MRKLKSPIGCLTALVMGLQVFNPMQLVAGEQQANFALEQVVQGKESSLTIELADQGFSGTKELVVTDYITEQVYEERGLMLRLDGIDNNGAGVHDDMANMWVNLANPDESISLDRETMVGGKPVQYFTEDAFVLNGSKVYLPESVAQVINSDAFTIEFFVDKASYSGMTRGYSPLITVDETADSFSIFVRSAGNTMELKQGSNTRLQTSFVNALDVPSAIVFKKGESSTWYANGIAQNSVVPQGNASASKVILGGRLTDNNGVPNQSYVTEASYHSVRIYDRALSEEQLKTNAAIDRSRFKGESLELAPDMYIAGEKLEDTGTTKVEVAFEDGVAVVPFQSNEKGEYTLRFELDNQSESITFTTYTLGEVAIDKVPEYLTLTNIPALASELEKIAYIQEAIENLLEETDFIAQGGRVQVGTSGNEYSVSLILNGESVSKMISVSFEYADSVEADVIEQQFRKVYKGNFSFSSQQEVTEDSIKNQVIESVGAHLDGVDVTYNTEEKVYELTLTKGATSKTQPLWINSEVVIDFNDVGLMNYVDDSRVLPSTSVAMQDGALVVKSTQSNTYENIVLPIWNFGRDYCIEVDLQVVDAVNDSRWAAISYGVEPNSAGGSNAWTFWQMAIRQNAAASNGVECANMTNGASPGWSVPYTTSFTEKLSPNKTYHLTIISEGGEVREYINGELMIKGNVAAKQKDGRIAFTFDRISAKFSNLRVSGTIPNLPSEFPVTENAYNTEIYEPVTSLVLSPSIVYEGESNISDMAAQQKRPATTVVTLNDNLTVTVDGKELSILEFMECLDKKVVAAFRIEEPELAGRFASYIEVEDIKDIFVISNRQDVLQQVCGKLPSVRGMLDFQNQYITQENLIDVVYQTNSANSRIAVLPEKIATPENVAYIQARAINVFVRTESEYLQQSIMSGADGLLVTDYNEAIDVIESFDDAEPVLTRQTVVTAHRGLHQNAPENSERATQEAILAGADAIECDIYLSADGYIMVNHDETTGRLMNENIYVASSAKDRLQSLTFNDKSQPGDKMPTLEELFKAGDQVDPNKEAVYVIEIKTSDPNIIKPLANLIREYEMSDRVVFISFSDAQLERIRKEMPEISVGALTAYANSANDAAKNLESLSDKLDGINAFYNCNYGAQNLELLKSCRHRGIYVHPWTVNSQNVFEEQYIENYHGITTDHAYFAADYLERVTTDEKSRVAYTGKENGIAILSNRILRSGEYQVVNDGDFRQIGGDAVVSYDQESQVYYSEISGTAVIQIKQSFTLPGTGKTYIKYSEPMDIIFEEVTDENQNKVTIQSKDSVVQGEVIEVTIGLGAIEKRVYAQDMYIEYDTDRFTLVGIEGKESKTGVYSQEAETGVRVLAATEGGLASGESSIVLTLQAKDTQDTQGIPSTITLKEIELGIVENDISEVVTAEEVSKSIMITPKEQQGIDKTQLNRWIDIAKELANNAQVGDGINQYPQSAVDQLNRAIAQAELVAQNSMDQNEINQAVETLIQAIKVFEASKNVFDQPDVNEDGIVNVADLALVAYYYHMDSPEALKVDINQDGVVDIHDLTIVANKILTQ